MSRGTGGPKARPLAERFWEKVKRGPGCWEWSAALSPAGYGYFLVGRRGHIAPRVCWTLVNGPIPDGLCVCHKCDNPRCVRPDHLFLATHRENMQDMARKGRRKRPPLGDVCHHGHQMLPENTAISRGRRVCRICRKLAMRRFRARHNDRITVTTIGARE